jgi:DNA polymerase-3 subunit delta'
MAFKNLSDQSKNIELLQRALERGRLAHGYLFVGDREAILEDIARTLAKTLNCLDPVRKSGVAVDCCDKCLSCQKIDHLNHGDVRWVRPESKSRVITIDQMREVMQQVNLKPTEAEYKVAIVVGADRMNAAASNAFLKTLEEPPASSILVLLTIEPERVLDTILSRCLRLNFAGDGHPKPDPAQLAWLTSFSQEAAVEQKSLFARYRLLDVLLQKLAELKTAIEENLTERSPLQRYKEIEKDLQEKWEDELKAAIEAEYRRQRSSWLLLLQWWLRDVWLCALGNGAHSEKAKDRARCDNGRLLSFPNLPGAAEVAGRVSAHAAQENLQIMEQLQRWLHTNVQEALALEVSLLKLSF